MSDIETIIGLSAAQLLPHVATATRGADDGELFVENVHAEQVVLKDGEIQSPSFSNSMGFGLRRVVGEFQAYAHSSEITPAKLNEAASNLLQARPGQGTLALPPSGGAGNYYAAISPLGAAYDLPRRIKLLQTIDAYVRGKDNRVRQVTIALAGKVQDVLIVRPDGYVAKDLRPLVHLSIQVIMDDGTRREGSHSSYGGRDDYAKIFANWQEVADNALRQADVMMQSIPCPAGEMPVILGAGGSGVIFHEAIGHGLEGDLIRQGSCFAGMLGQMVAAPGVTVVDDGTIAGSRGSLNVDDEGTPTENTVLIDNGKLVGYMNDRLNGRLHGTGSTGNGRRETYRHLPLVRMRNTYMLNGQVDPADIISNTKRAIYAVGYSGGQVDTTAGKFVFQATEAYLVENGQIVAPVKGATLIGSCLDGLKNIDLIGNDMKLEAAGGTCGKDGQGAPVNDGMPTIRMTSGIIVGGTDAA